MLHNLGALRREAALPNLLNNKDKAITKCYHQKEFKNLTNFECQVTFRGFLPNRQTQIAKILKKFSNIEVISPHIFKRHQTIPFRIN